MQGHSNPILTLQTHLQKDILSLNACILSCLKSDVPMVQTIAEHIIGAGGKRLRPLLTIACARFIKPDGDIDAAIALAAAVELIHTATLIHDDVIDESKMRRHAPTANALWDNKNAVLVGDFLFSKAFQLMVKGESLNIMDILAKASTRICEGEVLQLSFEGDFDTKLDDYRAIIELKTSALFEAACVVGAMAADGDKILCQKFHTFGHHLGIVFQILDDVLDYDTTAEKIGKCHGDDLREGKMTLPMILARDVDFDFTKTCFENPTDDHFKSLCGFIKNHNILNTARQYARDDMEKSIKAIADLNGPIPQYLTDIATAALHRTS